MVKKRIALITLFIIFSFSVCAFAVLTFSQVNAVENPNLISNGNFINKQEDWSATGIVLDDSNFIGKSVSGAKSGNGLKIEKSDGENIVISQTLANALESCKNYTFSFRYRTNLICSEGDIGSVYLSNDGGVISSTSTGLLATNQVWNDVVVDYVPSASETLTVKIDLKGAETTYYFSDFALTATIAIIKNGNFTDNDGVKAAGWSPEWSGTVYADNISNPYGYEEIISDGVYTNALKIERDNASVLGKNVLLDIYPTIQSSLLVGYSYKVSYKFKCNSQGDNDGSVYLVYKENSTASSNITCIDSNASEWKEKSFIYNCQYGGENPIIYIRLVYPKDNYSSEKTTLYLADVKIEKQNKSEDHTLSNGSFDNVVNNYPAEWGILGGKSAVSSNKLTLSNPNGETAIGASFMTSVFSGLNYKLKFKLKASGSAVKENFKILITPYSDYARTTLPGDSTTVINMKELFVTGGKANMQNSYSLDYQVPETAKFVDVSFTATANEAIEFTLTQVSLSLPETEKNLDFELGDGPSVMYWTESSCTLVRESGSRPDGDGAYIAKITGFGAGSKIVTARYPLESCSVNEYYELSYWIKADIGYSTKVYPQVVLYTASGTASKAVVYGSNANPGNGLKQYTQLNNNVNYAFNYVTYGSTITPTNPDGWVLQRLTFKIASDTNYCIINFFISGEGNVVYLDDFAITKISSSSANLDFENFDDENNPENWYMTQNREEHPVLKVVDDVYHSGSHSLYANVDSIVSGQYIQNPYLIPVNPNGAHNIYEASFWIASRNSTTKTIQLDTWFHGEDGVKVYTNSVGLMTPSFTGVKKSLNSNGEISEWSQVICHVSIEKDIDGIPIKYVTLNFSLTTGSAELWIDDITFTQVESDDEIILFAQDGHAKDQNGNISGFRALDNNGEQVDGVLSNGYDDVEGYYVKLDKTEDASVVYKTDKTFTDYEYALTAVFKSNYHVNLRIRFFDYMHNEYADAMLTKVFATNVGSWTEVTYTYVAHSATFTEFWFDNGGQGDLCIANLVLRQTNKPSNVANWRGYWVSYKQDFRHCDEYSYSYFRGEVYVDENKELVSAPLQFTGDDKIAMWVNGELVIDGTQSMADTWASIKVLNIIDYVKKGRNVLAFMVYNGGAYSAMLYDGIWKYDDGEEFFVISDKNVICKNGTENPATDNWYDADYDVSDWHGVYVQGSVPMNPWGAVYYDSSLYIDNKIEINVVEGDNKYVGNLEYEFTLDIKPEKALTANVAMNMTLTVRNSTKTICDLTPVLVENGNMMSWVAGEWNRVKFKVYLPDYLDSGSYVLQLSKTFFLITNDNIYDNKFISFRAENNYTPVELETKVEMINGVPTYTVNGEPKAEFWYIFAINQSETSLDRISESGIESIVNFNLKYGSYEASTEELWQSTGTINYESLDKKLNTMVAASPDANIIVTLSMYAPAWWIEQHPGCITAHMDESNQILVSNGSQVSFGSTEWRDQGAELLKKTIEHMRTQNYYAKVAGFRLAGGGTAEMITFDSQSDSYTADYSPVALKYFKNWAKEYYGTIERLRIAWNDPTIESFDSIVFPTFAELTENKGTNGHYDPVTQQKIIDFRKIAGIMTADCVNTWAKAIKEACDYKLAVGIYYGYLWGGPTFGVATQELSAIYGSEYLDYFFSPAGYNERQLGESEFAQAVSDSARAYGKMFITEQDNRTCLSMPFAGTKWNTPADFSVGVTHTFNDTLLQEKRDAIYNICNGNGQWMYDMQGGWIKDTQIFEFTNDLNAEYNFMNYVERDLLNDIAMIVPDGNITHGKFTVMNDSEKIKMANTVLSQYMYKQHRKELDKMGAGYDTYALSTMLDGKMPEYKVYVFFNPYILTDAERKAIQEHCQKNGSVCIFLMESGWGYDIADLDERIEDLQKPDCKIGYNESYITDLTGFNVKVEPITNTSVGSAGQVRIIDSACDITNGIVGLKFGAMTSSISYLRRTIYAVNEVGNPNYCALGVLEDDPTKTGLAIKTMPTKDGTGTWTSIWCAAPCISQDVYRAILKYVGIHIYSEDESMIVWNNSAYIGAHSASSGTKTLYLDGYYSVYDVFEKRYVSMNTNVITYYNEVNDSHLFRLGKVDTCSVLARVSGGHGTITNKGITEVPKGENLSYVITADEGYIIKSVKVNGEEVQLDENNSLTLVNVSDSYQIVVQFKRAPIAEYVEHWVEDERSVQVPTAIVVVILVVVFGAIVGFIVYKNFFKKGVRK